jgi:cation:H+ antiporter
MIWSILITVAGLGLLVVASERFVAGASGVSLRLRLPAVIVGAVIVGFGTSVPELLVSSLAALEGARDIAVGNVVGSNLANLTLVLGITALVAVPVIGSKLIRREMPLALIAMLCLAAALPWFTRWSAAGLLVAFALLMVVILRSSLRDRGDALAAETEHDLVEVAHRSWTWLVLATVGGLVGTVVGAQLLVTGAQDIAAGFGLADGFVGFTLVALGTSLPEAVTSVHAARRGEPDLAIGNVIGSNIFNSVLIGGAIGLISPGEVAGGLVLVAWITVGVGALAVGLMRTGFRLVRWEAAVLVVAYFATLPLVA